VCGIDTNNGGNYIALKNTINNLTNKSNWIKIKREDGECETIIRWIEKPYIYEKSGTIKIRLDKDMKPFLLELKERFTMYSLYYTLAMKSKYSVRMYELFKSYQYKYTCEFEIEELKNILLAENYVAFKDFRIKVIEIAVKEINEYSDIFVKYEFEKKGRKFHKVIFKINPKKSPDVETIRKIEERLTPRQLKGQMTMIEHEAETEKQGANQ
jgi:plasmid replication initiation protein